MINKRRIFEESMFFGMDMAMFYNEVVYVKGCDGFWLYERRSGIRGARINGTNHDKTEHFVINNRNVEIGLFLTKHKELEL